MLGELAVAHAEGQFAKTVKLYKQVRLLIINEWLLFHVADSDAKEILEIVNARHKRASTIFCTQFVTDRWHAPLMFILADANVHFEVLP